MLIAIKKIAPALAAGNSIVLKPSELAPVSVLEVCVCKEETFIKNVTHSIFCCTPRHSSQHPTP